MNKLRDEMWRDAERLQAALDRDSEEEAKRQPDARDLLLRLLDAHREHTLASEKAAVSIGSDDPHGVWMAKREARSRAWAKMVKACAELEAALSRDASERARLATGFGELLGAVMRGRLASIGSERNTYCPQIGVDEVERARAALEGR